MRYCKNAVLAALFLFTTFLCTAQLWKGKMIYGYAGNSIKQYDFSTKADKVLLEEAQQPFATPAGELFYLDQNFRKRNVLLRKSNSSYTRFTDVLDMSSENPRYKQRLAEYSVIRGTGNSAVLSSLHSPKVSPNGQYVALTVYGYGDQVFNKNCVAVFSLATGELITKFEHKYYGSWTPDNRLVMAGADKTESTDGSLTKAVTPGIFITDKALSVLTRIDPELNDPAPYHPAVSPDGKQVAFILNNHVWVMGIDGSQLRQLTAADNDNIETYPVWSPDGKWIACWAYKTFERSYYTAIAVVPASSPQPVALTNTAPVWPKDSRGYRISGGSKQLAWLGTVQAGTAVAGQKGTTTGTAPAPAPAPRPKAEVGTKVRFSAVDGKTYTGVIAEVANGQFKIRYDGYDFTAWLTREQFEVYQ